MIRSDSRNAGVKSSAAVEFGCRRMMLLAIGVCCLGTAGCLHRRMTISTDPPGARVLLDGDEIGLTPVSHDFTYYGTREITLIKDGYKTRTIMQKVRTPWYQLVPLDFFSDNFLPFKVTNRHSFFYQMERQVPLSQQEFLDRAQELRSESHVGQ
ncbi:MAG: PEGA domain-containing protein [Planctomycetes bacterium]|nr:PEGA domain-containing protein [Planctomycetota bacterium]